MSSNKTNILNIKLKEIRVAFQSLKNHKVCSLDQITNEMLKYGSGELLPTAKLLKTVFQYGNLPSMWIGYITLIHKMGSKQIKKGRKEMFYLMTHSTHFNMVKGPFI